MPNFSYKISRVLVALTAICVLAFALLAVPAVALEGAGLPSDMGNLTGPRYTPRASDDTVGADTDVTDVTGSDSTDSTNGTDGTDGTNNTNSTDDTNNTDSTDDTNNTDSTDSTDNTDITDNNDITDSTDNTDSTDVTDTAAVDTDITESFDSNNTDSDNADAAQDDFAVWGIFIVLLVIAGVAVLILALMPKKRKK